jgi:Spy/CpxP family protein refolding chaperone
MKKLLLSTIIFFSTLALNAQNVDDIIEAVKSNIKTERKAIIIQSMNFTEAESAAFWPVYNEFEIELEKLANNRVKNIKEYAINYEKMTDKKAEELIKNSLKFQEDRVSLNKKYYNKFAKVLTPITAAKYMQLENQIQLIMDLKIASELPMIKKPVSKTTK